jgi:CO dehydrogenase maturation factor
MSALLAVSGKGGAGKTAVAAGLVLSLREELNGPILAVDADPNSTLGDALGIPWSTTLANVREATDRPAGVAKADVVEFGVEQAVAEGEGIDLLVMGRPEGPGCYCAVNHLLRGSLQRIARRYEAVVIDNEAGMEHLSRRTTDEVAALLVITGPTVVSLRAARQVLRLAQDEGLRLRRRILVMNQWPSPAPAHLAQEADSITADRRVRLLHSSHVADAYERGHSLTHLPPRDRFRESLRADLVPLALDLIRGRDDAW